MSGTTIRSKLLLTVVLAAAPGFVWADEIRVAVASNFAGAMKAIVAAFEAGAEHEVTLSFGSTGKHYAQIVNGAPFDAFFAADVSRPELLEEEGVALPGSRFTYAIGKLVLWSPRADYVDADGKIIEQGDFRYLAIANPKLAPYGRAAVEVLRARALWEGLDKRIVRGENIGQTFQFVQTGNAELGFVAYAQVRRRDRPVDGSQWLIPQSLYTPIEQQAVLLTESEAAREFLSFIRGSEASNIIRAHGYEVLR